MKSKKMECLECDFPHELKARRVVHKYKECGLNFVTLTGVSEFKCPQCGAVYFEIPQVAQLNRMIADSIMKKQSLLSSPELRFLRKQLGYSTEQFGRLLSYDPKTLSRIENGHQKITPTFDRLVRMAYGTGRRDLNYNLHDFLLGQGVQYRRLEFSLQAGEDWTLKKSAA